MISILEKVLLKKKKEPEVKPEVNFNEVLVDLASEVEDSPIFRYEDRKFCRYDAINIDSFSGVIEFYYKGRITRTMKPPRFEPGHTIYISDLVGLSEFIWNP